MITLTDKILADAGTGNRQAQQLVGEAEALATLLRPARVVALAADNGPHWLAADIACVQLQKPCIPLPHFFTQTQTQWAVDSAGVDTLLTDQPDHPAWKSLGFDDRQAVGSLFCLRRSCAAVALPANTAKITFTSGSTGNPKGVCLSVFAQQSVAASIAGIMVERGVERHLCALPLPILLENVAGFYAAMLAGIDYVAPPLAAVGWSGSSQWDARAFLQCVVDERIGSAIILPQMLKALLPLLGQYDTSSLQMVAVGGARVAPELLESARIQGLPVYEGYGLSECSSVVCFNHPAADKPGTVGKPLPHASVRINGEGELEVAGSYYEGYLGQPDTAIPTWLPTGDLASIDHEGFVTITGRKKNLLISSFGRNISPEWVESELLGQAGIVQAAVFGEAKPWLTAVIVAPQLADSALQEAVARANSKLPDYAQVRHYLHAAEPFTPANGLATSNGRNKRDALYQTYGQYIENLYSTSEGISA